MTYAIRIDCFTSLDDLKGKERRDPEAVLAVLRRVGRYSVWDMDNRDLCNTVMALQRSGQIVPNDSLGFPWIAVTVPSPTSPPLLRDTAALYRSTTLEPKPGASDEDERARLLAEHFVRYLAEPYESLAARIAALLPPETP